MNKITIRFSAQSSDAIQLLSTQMLSMDVAQWKVWLPHQRTNDGPNHCRVPDSNSVQKNRYAGIYLRARDTVQRSRVRYAKATSGVSCPARFFAWISRFSQKAAVASPIRAQDNVRKEAPVQPPLVWPELIWS